MKEGLIKDTFEMMAREIQLVLSLCYVLMIGVGMIFNYYKYQAFGINIFEYADIFDFLIAPFADWRIVGFAIASTIMPYLIYRFDRWWEHKYPKSYRITTFGWSEKSWYGAMRAITFAMLFLMYMQMAAILYGERASDRVRLQSTVQVSYSDGEHIKGQMIGKTSNTLFLLRQNEVRVIPLNGMVKAIELDLPEPEVKEPGVEEV